MFFIAGKTPAFLLFLPLLKSGFGLILYDSNINQENGHMSLNIIAELSRLYGADPRFVLAGGGNTSYKDDKNLYIKPSGVALADITEKDFVKMDRARIRELFTMVPPVEANEREALVKRVMEMAVCPDSSGRPSVEAPLHEAMDATFVVHLHPALVNGMTCGKEGKSKCSELFPDSLWIDYIDPGYSLAVHVQKEIAKFAVKHGRQPEIIFIQNHGVFVGANNSDGMKRAYAHIMDKLMSYYDEKNVNIVLEKGISDVKTVMELSPKLRTWLGDGSSRMIVKSSAPLKIADGPLTPDHIVYAKSFALIADKVEFASVAKFAEQKGYRPLVVSVPGKAIFTAAKSLKDANTVELLARDAVLVQQLAHAFGGPNYLSEKSYKFIENWKTSWKGCGSHRGCSGFWPWNCRRTCRRRCDCRNRRHQSCRCAEGC
jgi:rhamnose utilization protein RhaD (predicted bifunctional aldolase and dehydrogenase)